MPSLPVNTSLPARSHLIMRDNAACAVVALKCKRKLHGSLPRGQPLRSASPYNIRKQNKNAKWRSYQKLEVRSESSPVNVAGKASFCSSFVECFLHHNAQFLLYIRMLCIIAFPRNGYRQRIVLQSGIEFLEGNIKGTSLLRSIKYVKQRSAATVTSVATSFGSRLMRLFSAWERCADFDGFKHLVMQISILAELLWLIDALY